MQEAPPIFSKGHVRTVQLNCRS